MITKILEIRDRATFISVIAMRLVAGTDIERHHFMRNGYGADGAGAIVVLRIGDTKAENDPYKWDDRYNRTMHEAHKWIARHFDELDDGDVVDVEFILGETTEKKTAERLMR